MRGQRGNEGLGDQILPQERKGVHRLESDRQKNIRYAQAGNFGGKFEVRGWVQLGNKVVAVIGVQMLMNFQRGYGNRVISLII